MITNADFIEHHLNDEFSLRMELDDGTLTGPVGETGHNRDTRNLSLEFSFYPKKMGHAVKLRLYIRDHQVAIGFCDLPLQSDFQTTVRWNIQLNNIDEESALGDTVKPVFRYSDEIVT